MKAVKILHTKEVTGDEIVEIKMKIQKVKSNIKEMRKVLTEKRFELLMTVNL